MPGPHCGNNPHFQMSPGDRAAVDEARAYLASRTQEAHMPEATPIKTTVTYFIQSRPAPSQPWQQPSGAPSTRESETTALRKLAARRELQPGWEHQLMKRTTTVTVTEEPVHTPGQPS